MIIGSTAMKHWFPDFREPKDKDNFSPDPALSGDNFWHESFPEVWSADYIATPSQLYTIKVSHAYWDLHGTWNKHMSDIVFLQRQGAELNREMYDILYPVWKDLHGKKRTSLAKTKEDFFGDAVVRKYDHDSVHESVAYGDRPMYTHFLKEGAEVDIDNDKFWAPEVSIEDQFKTIREEVYATALERWVIPSNYAVSPRAAYARAMKKCVTSLFKGRWALFIVTNYDELSKPDMDYVLRHRSNSDRLILL